MARSTKYNEQHQEQADGLHRRANDHAESVQARALGNFLREHVLDPTVGEISKQDDKENPQRRLHYAVQGRPLLRLDQCDPATVVRS